MVMSFGKGDIVKFQGNESPCIIYRVINPTEQLVYCKTLGRICEHISIEVMGLVPVELLVPAEEEGNAYALDVKLNLTGQSN